MVGVDRAAASFDAQLRGRGLTTALSSEELVPHTFHKFTPCTYGDPHLWASDWSAFAVRDSNAGARSCGNHVCRPIVCHKGRLGKMGLCRLAYWSYQECCNEKGAKVMKRVHGKELMER